MIYFCLIGNLITEYKDKKMKIMIDARKIGNAGVRTYAVELVKKILMTDQQNKYIILLTKGNSDIVLPPKGNFEVIEGPANPLLFWLVWNNTVLPYIIKKKHVHIYHNLKHVTALFNKSKNIITFHSARLFFHPDHYGIIEYLYWKIFQPICAKKYNTIIAVSQAEKNHYADHLNISQKKIKVTHLASADKFKKIDDETLKKSVKKQFKLPDHFILTVGRIHPVKNMETSIRAFAIAKYQYKIPHKFVIVGGFSKYLNKLKIIITQEKLENEVIFTGPIMKELPVIYNLADLFLSLSWYESFHQVSLEAMTCGLPMILSNKGGIPEVFEGVAILHEPDDFKAVADSIAKVLNSVVMQSEMINKGLHKAKQFSWGRTVAQTLKTYNYTMNCTG